MKTVRVLTHYNETADTPDAVPRLRRFVLDLAVRGKLVKQNPDDEPASELLKRIGKEKTRQALSGEIRKQKTVLCDNHLETTFDLPVGWVTTTIGTITVCLDYLRKPINGADRKKRIAGKDEAELFPYFGATQQQGWIDDYIFDEELVLLGEDGVPFFDTLRPKAYLISGKTWVNNHAHVFRGVYISNAYLVHCLNVFDYSGRVAGSTRSKLNQAKALGISIPLPPLPEQHRIVAKVDKLMQLCDRLELARKERESTRDRLVSASLARLNTPVSDPTVFRNDAVFAIKNLKTITKRSDQIKAIRQTILYLSVRGKLVAQDTADEPASELLKYFVSEKARLVKTGKIRNPREFRGGSDVSEPYEIPMSWCWVRLDALGAIVGGGTPQTHYDGNFTGSGMGVPWLTPADLGRSKGLYISNGKRDLTQKGLKDSSANLLPEGSVLFTSRAPIGYVAIAANPLATNQGFKSIVPFVPDCSRFIALTMKAFAGEIDAKASGTTFKEVSGKTLAGVSFPLPPLAEQNRIVAKVDEFMNLFDRLETSLENGEKTRDILLGTLLNNTLKTTNESETSDKRRSVFDQ